MQELIDRFPNKTAYIFELDNVIFPSKDYDLQVYYLFGQFMEFTFPGIHEGKRILDFLVNKHGTMSRSELIDATIDHFAITPEFKENFERLFRIARLPLKLLMFQQTLEFMQTLVADRKQIFIVTKGDPEEQLNKIKQIEWNGLEAYLKVYFVEETEPNDIPSTITKLLTENELLNQSIVMVGKTTFKLSEIDFIPISELVKI
ncbi:HAD hydrolase-like protein [Solitalea sp. MAHUQ-68]|uniref:HAD hydrolase-like protein n=1 Tax=Solitalea agri TaxID=2953739 RepID=A0A9X2EZW5_9SPHI|nr:HAD hydrolase-like protein [Solitalea agri]MCO4291651.1 HAD hydrolase-like protein [Solitalea agri]